MVDYTRLISEIEESSAFVLPDGSRLKSLKSLIEKLAQISDDVFFKHVNQSKNDFANWIAGCFHDELLAQRISKMTTKQEIAKEISTRLEQAKISLQMQPQEQNAKDTEERQIKEGQVAHVPEEKAGDGEPLEPDLELDVGLGLDEKPEISQTGIDDSLGLDVENELQKPEQLDASLDSALDSEPLPISLPPVQKEISIPQPETLEPEKTVPEISKQEKIGLKEIKSTLPPVDAGVAEDIVLSTKPAMASTPKEAAVKAEGEKSKGQELAARADEALKKAEQITAKEEKKETSPIPEPEKIYTKQELPDTSDKRLLETESRNLKPAELFRKLRLLKQLSLPEIKQEQAPKAPAQTFLQNMPGQVASEVKEELLEEQEKALLADNSKLSLKNLFRKLKAQKESRQKIVGLAGKDAAVQMASLMKAEEQARAQKEQAPPDILNLSDDEFNRLIGINSQEEFVATMSTEDIVKIKQRKHLKTGVPGFDELVDKGIPEGSSILVSGGPGSGKTTFCIQQLGWAAEHGEKCLFISLEEQEERLVEHMKGFGLNPEKYLKNEYLKVKKVDSFKLSRAVEALLAHARGELLIDIEPVLDIIPEGYKPDRVVIDSLSSIAAAFAGRNEEYRVYVEQLFNIFSRLNVTSFIITEIHGSESSGHGGVEDFLADGVINFYSMKKGTIRQPAVEILKLRGVNHKRKIVPFNFIPGKGIEIYPLEEVFHEWQ